MSEAVRGAADPTKPRALEVLPRLFAQTHAIASAIRPAMATAAE